MADIRQAPNTSTKPAIGELRKVRRRKRRKLVVATINTPYSNDNYMSDMQYTKARAMRRKRSLRTNPGSRNY